MVVGRTTKQRPRHPCRGLDAFVIRELLAIGHRNVRRRISRAGVVGAWADEAVIVVLFNDVGSPAGDAADGEDGSEEVDVDAEGGVGRGGVEVDVGVELLDRKAHV